MGTEYGEESGRGSGSFELENATLSVVISQRDREVTFRECAETSRNGNQWILIDFLFQINQNSKKHSQARFRQSGPWFLMKISISPRARMLISPLFCSNRIAQFVLLLSVFGRCRYDHYCVSMALLSFGERIISRVLEYAKSILIKAEHEGL